MTPGRLKEPEGGVNYWIFINKITQLVRKIAGFLMRLFERINFRIEK